MNIFCCCCCLKYAKMSNNFTTHVFRIFFKQQIYIYSYLNLFSLYLHWFLYFHYVFMVSCHLFIYQQNNSTTCLWSVRSFISCKDKLFLASEKNLKLIFLRWLLWLKRNKSKLRWSIDEMWFIYTVTSKDRFLKKDP